MFLQTIQITLLFRNWKYTQLWNWCVQASLFLFGLYLMFLAVILRLVLIVIRAAFWLRVIPRSVRRLLEQQQALQPTYINHIFVFYQVFPLLMLPLLR